MTRFLSFLYGLVAYAIFLGAFLHAIAFVSGSPLPLPLALPKTIDIGPASPGVQATIVNMLLMSLFALQHSIMARPRFKRWWTQFVSPAIERSTYVLFASLALILLMWQWRPITEVVWQIADPNLALAVQAISFLGWGIVLLSTFLINHFELFGLQQVVMNIAGRAPAKPHFTTPLLYNVVRHPIYLGFIIAFWAAPTMTFGHLLFAAVTTAYIFIGIALEERDMITVFGEEYRRYRQQVGMLMPFRRG
jgi:methanethiol S-methyltransferase